MNYILVAQSCGSCGAKMAVKSFKVMPGEKDIEDITRSLGGMWCISTTLFQVDEDGDCEEIKID